MILFCRLLYKFYIYNGLNNQKVEWLSDSLPILDETLDTRVLYIMNCWPDIMGNGFAVLIDLYLQRRLMFKSHFTSAVIRHIYLTSNVDLKWPLNFMKNNRNYLLTKYYLHTKFEVQATFTSWDIVLQSFYTLTSGDLKWPLTFMKNNRDHLLTKGY